MLEIIKESQTRVRGSGLDAQATGEQSSLHTEEIESLSLEELE